jgi:hypothetical protein
MMVPIVKAQADARRTVDGTPVRTLERTPVAYPRLRVYRIKNIKHSEECEKWLGQLIRRILELGFL